MERISHDRVMHAIWNVAAEERAERPGGRSLADSADEVEFFGRVLRLDRVLSPTRRLQVCAALLVVSALITIISTTIGPLLIAAAVVQVVAALALLFRVPAARPLAVAAAIIGLAAVAGPVWLAVLAASTPTANPLLGLIELLVVNLFLVQILSLRDGRASAGRNG